MPDMKTQGPAAAILLASGFSKRFGERNKLLVPFRGKPLVRHTLELVSGMDFPGGIFLVAASDEVAARAEDMPEVKVIGNTAPEKGLRESVRLGVEAAGVRAEYFLFFHCDEPFLDAATVQSILDARRPGCIVEPRFRDRPGNPCLFSSAFRKDLLTLKEGETPKVIKARRRDAVIGVEVQDQLILEDIDDEAKLKSLLGKL